jgi:glutamine cyclotransferase
MTLKNFLFQIMILAFAGTASWAGPGSNDSLKVPITTPLILQVLPHDERTFTQGLFFSNGLLYESSGLYGKSFIRTFKPQDNRTLSETIVPDVFAEGIALWHGSLVALTWKEGSAVIYSLPGLAIKGSFHYEGEGWGLATEEGKGRFYMSNGSDTIYVRDSLFAIVKKIRVIMGGEPLKNLNELEIVGGRIYANIWYSPFIAEISRGNGAVLRLIDCRELIRAEAPASQENVLNGIAYNPETGNFYLTGKNWHKIFEVKLR